MARKDRPDRLEGRKRATAVEGRVLWPRLDKAIMMAVTGVVGATGCLGIGLYLMIRVGEGTQFLGAKLVGYGLFLVLYLLAGGGILIFLLLRMRRLIIGEDRLQLLSDVGRIIGQLPYDNILDLQLQGDQFGILLDKPNRKDTWWPSWADDRSGYHVQLTSGFETDATALKLYLRDALRDHQRRTGGRGLLSQ